MRENTDQKTPSLNNFYEVAAMEGTNLKMAVKDKSKTQ